MNWRHPHVAACICFALFLFLVIAGKHESALGWAVAAAAFYDMEESA